MLKQIHDRLAYALIGAVFGAVIGAALWYFYDAGFSSRIGAPEIHAGLAAWVQYAGGFFAVLGFLFKAGVGSAVGGTVNEVYDYERGKRPNAAIPVWFAVILVVAIAVCVCYWLR